MKRSEINADLRRTAEGDEKAFERLYEQTKGGVYSFAYSYLKNREDAEDAVQTVFLKIKQNISSFVDCGNGLAWMLEITKNVALNELRKRKISEQNLPEKSEAVSFDDYESEGIVTDAMRKVLTDEEQRIIILHVIWGYKHREIADIMQMPTGSVTSKYKRAADKIKTYLKKEA